jgi:hypothetical protein
MVVCVFSVPSSVSWAATAIGPTTVSSTREAVTRISGRGRGLTAREDRRTLSKRAEAPDAVVQRFLYIRV